MAIYRRAINRNLNSLTNMDVTSTSSVPYGADDVNETSTLVKGLINEYHLIQINRQHMHCYYSATMLKKNMGKKKHIPYPLCKNKCI